MGRSLAPIGGPEDGPPTGTATGLPLERRGCGTRSSVATDACSTRRRDAPAAGDVLSEIEAEVQYALGSGRRGINFLIERDGFVFLSPIAWFAQQGRWDVSPGFEERAQQTNFERAIYPNCLFCHTNEVRPLAGPLNRYETPIFRGHAIGCERCHGPGELHVNRDGLSAESDLTIVNPAELAPALRDSVCQQCHLQGAYRTTRAGRGSFDFRPGLPIHRFWAVIQMKKGDQDQFEAVGHVEQIEASRCFRESEGQLGCISCHDPHRLPEPSTKAAYYRARCISCHDRKGCALPSAERQSRGQGEDCVACHMPRLDIANIPHTAATDHRIPRGVPDSVQERPRGAPGQPGEIPLLDYHWGLMTAEERQDASRDLGVASAWIAQRMAAAPSWPGPPRHRPSRCSKRPSATVPTTCPPAIRSESPWRFWDVGRRRFASLKGSFVSIRLTSWPSGIPVDCWPASNGPTWLARCCRRRSRSIPGGRIIAWCWLRSAPRPGIGPERSQRVVRRSGSIRIRLTRGHSSSSLTCGPMIANRPTPNSRR